MSEKISLDSSEEGNRIRTSASTGNFANFY